MTKQHIPSLEVPGEPAVRSLRDRIAKPADQGVISAVRIGASDSLDIGFDPQLEAGRQSYQAGAPIGAPQRHRHPKRGGSWFKTILGYAGLALVCIGLMLATFLFIADPAELIADQMVARVKAQTGRELAIRGGVRIALFPSIGISMSDVSLSAPPGMGGGPTIKMDRLTAALKVMPLLSSQVVVEHLVMKKPIINLHVDRRGRKNWDFASRQTDMMPRPIRVAQVTRPGHASDALPPVLLDFAAGSRAMQDLRSPLAMLAGLSLNDVRLSDGTLSYRDDRTGEKQRLDAINVTVALKDIDSPLSAKGNLRWQGETITLAASVKSLKALLDHRSTALNAQLSARAINLRYNGTVTLAPTDGADSSVKLDGDVTAKSKSVRQLAAWLGTQLPPASGFGALDLKGHLKIAGNRINLQRARLTFDGATMNGLIGVVTGGVRPKINADLKLTALDLNKYMAAGPTAGNKNNAAGRTTNKKPKGGSSFTRSITDILNTGSTGGSAKKRSQRRGAKQSKQTAGWSREPIDTKALSTIDVDAQLSVGALMFLELRAGATRLHVTLNNGRLRANLRDMQLYGGQGRAVIVLTPKTRGLALNANVTVTRISALPLARDAAGFDYIDGLGDLTFKIRGSGQNEQQIIKSLNGNGHFEVTDGAIVGINIPKLIRGLKRGQFTNLNMAASEKTDFSNLKGSFAITQGVLDNADLRLTSPLLRLTGSGRVFLPARSLDYTVRPKIVSSLSGQGNTDPLNGLEIPVRIRGSWENPKISGDFAGALKALARDPDKVINTIKKFSRALKGGNEKETLGGLFNKGTKDKAKKLFDQFLR